MEPAGVEPASETFPDATVRWLPAIRCRPGFPSTGVLPLYLSRMSKRRLRPRQRLLYTCLGSTTSLADAGPVGPGLQSRSDALAGDEAVVVVGDCTSRRRRVGTHTPTRTSPFTPRRNRFGPMGLPRLSNPGARSCQPFLIMSADFL